MSEEKKTQGGNGKLNSLDDMDTELDVLLEAGESVTIGGKKFEIKPKSLGYIRLISKKFASIFLSVARSMNMKEMEKMSFKNPGGAIRFMLKGFDLAYNDVLDVVQLIIDDSKRPYDGGVNLWRRFQWRRQRRFLEWNLTPKELGQVVKIFQEQSNIGELVKNVLQLGGTEPAQTPGKPIKKNKKTSTTPSS